MFAIYEHTLLDEITLSQQFNAISNERAFFRGRAQVVLTGSLGGLHRFVQLQRMSKSELQVLYMLRMLCCIDKMRIMEQIGCNWFVNELWTSDASRRNQLRVS